LATNRAQLPAIFLVDECLTKQQQGANQPSAMALPIPAQQQQHL
jgi:hypothetical protein